MPILEFYCYFPIWHFLALLDNRALMSRMTHSSNDSKRPSKGHPTKTTKRDCAYLEQVSLSIIELSKRNETESLDWMINLKLSSENRRWPFNADVVNDCVGLSEKKSIWFSSSSFTNDDHFWNFQQLYRYLIWITGEREECSKRYVNPPVLFYKGIGLLISSLRFGLFWITRRKSLAGYGR